VIIKWARVNSAWNLVRERGAIDQGFAWWSIKSAVQAGMTAENARRRLRTLDFLILA